MTQAERDRLVALKKAKKKLITQKEAAEELGITERHVRRLLRQLKRRGDKVVAHGLRGLPLNALAWCARRLRAAPAKAVTVLYEAHGADEQYLNERDVEVIYRRLLPGSRVELHLEWRYTIVWELPGATGDVSASSRG